MTPPSSSAVFVSVVVPTLNEEAHVGHLLSDLECQTRKPEEVIVVDAGSCDATGDVLVFLDADVRLTATFLERFLEEFLHRRLEIACPLYASHDTTSAVAAFHTVFNLMTRAFQGFLPSGAGICVAVRGDLFRRSRGFDSRKFDDIELIRRLSREGCFGIVGEKVFVSDRRYREHGVLRMILEYSLLALIFALGKFEWANRLDYEFGKHGH